MSTKNQTQAVQEATQKRQPQQPNVQGLESLGEQVNLTPALQRARVDPHLLNPRDMLPLQRTIGNRAVSQVITSTKSGTRIQRQLPDIEIKQGFWRWGGKGNLNEQEKAEAKAYHTRYILLIDNEIRKLQEKENASAKEIAPFQELFDIYKQNVEKELYYDALATLEKLVPQLNKYAASKGTSAEANWKTPFEPEEKKKIIPVLEIIDKTIGEVVNPIYNELLKTMFGEEGKETAKETFRKIQESLNSIYAGNRFIKDTTGYLASQGMGALASEETGAEAKIMLAATALEKPEDLAVKLIHEGSHTLPDAKGIALIIDFCYRTGWTHGYLPTPVALKNAANYEQVAADILNIKEKDKGITETRDKLHRSNSMLGQTLALVDLFITRTWVRLGDWADEFRKMSDYYAQNKNASEPPSAWQQIPERTRHVAELLNLPVLEQINARQNFRIRKLDTATISMYHDEAGRLMKAIRKIDVQPIQENLKAEVSNQSDSAPKKFHLKYNGASIMEWQEENVTSLPVARDNLIKILIEQVVGSKNKEILRKAVTTIDSWDRPASLEDLKHIPGTEPFGEHQEAEAWGFRYA
jgi:hypothetical protein